MEIRQKINKTIKIYCPDGHAEQYDWQRYLIHPIRAFWGDGSNEWNNYQTDFEFYKKYIRLVDSIEVSDAVFLPMAINYYILNNKLKLLNDLHKSSIGYNKKLFIWIEGDFDLRTHLPGCVYLKFASFKSKKFDNEILRPGDVKKDLLKHYCGGELKLRNKTDTPIIGFDGLASYNSFRLGGLILKNTILNLNSHFGFSYFNPPPILPLLLRRNFILNKLENCHGISTLFNRRDQFAIGLKLNNITARKEYVENICNSDYTLCVRGASNYSLRFYETLCLGRIPLLINTDCVFPFENEINYTRITLSVDDKNIHYIGEIVKDFHASLHNDDFQLMQMECRAVWEKYFTPEGFFQHLFHFLQNNRLINNL